MSIVNFDHPEEYLFPRFTPGSLAERVAEGEIGTLHPVPPGRCMMIDEGDAVERLTAAARAIVDSYSLDTHCGCGACCECVLVTAVEAAEKWKP